jgi:hypothetical protein
MSYYLSGSDRWSVLKKLPLPSLKYWPQMLPGQQEKMGNTAGSSGHWISSK